MPGGKCPGRARLRDMYLSHRAFFHCRSSHFPLPLVSLTKDLDQIISKIAESISWLLQFLGRDMRAHVDIDGAVVYFQNYLGPIPEGIFSGILARNVMSN